MPDVELKAIYCKMHLDGQLVDPFTSADVLIKYLEQDSFENGAHVDYYDLI